MVSTIRFDQPGTQSAFDDYRDAIVAVPAARELAGFCWAVATQEPPPVTLPAECGR